MTSQHINKLDMCINKCLVKSSYDLTITSHWRHTVKWMDTTIHPSARSTQHCIWHVFTSRTSGLSITKAPQKKYWIFSLHCSVIHCSQQRVKIPHSGFRARKDVATVCQACKKESPTTAIHICWCDTICSENNFIVVESSSSYRDVVTCTNTPGKQFHNNHTSGKRT